MEIKEYIQTKEMCEANITGVCDACGGPLTAFETVDNCDRPTFLPGCEACSKFCWGVSPQIYEVAKRLVDECYFVAYTYMENPKHKKPNDQWAIDNYRYSQISGACSIVRDVLRLNSEVKK